MAAQTDVTPLKLDPKYDDYDFPTLSESKLSGHSGHVSPEQEAQVAQLRMMLEAKGCTERLDTLTLVGKHTRILISQLLMKHS